MICFAQPLSVSHNLIQVKHSLYVHSYLHTEKRFLTGSSKGSTKNHYLPNNHSMQWMVLHVSHMVLKGVKMDSYYWMVGDGIELQNNHTFAILLLLLLLLLIINFFVCFDRNS